MTFCEYVTSLMAIVLHSWLEHCLFGMTSGKHSLVSMPSWNIEVSVGVGNFFMVNSTENSGKVSLFIIFLFPVYNTDPIHQLTVLSCVNVLAGW